MKSRSTTTPPLLPWGIKLVLLLIGVLVVYVAGRIPAEQRARQAELAAEQQRKIAIRAEQTASSAAQDAEAALREVKQAVQRVEDLQRSLQARETPAGLPATASPTVAATIDRVQQVGDAVLQWALNDALLPGVEEAEDGAELQVRFPAAELLRGEIEQGGQRQLFIAWNDDGIAPSWDSVGWKYDLGSRQVSLLIAEERSTLSPGETDAPSLSLARFRVLRTGARTIVVHFTMAHGGAELTFEESPNGLKLTAVSTHVS